MGDVESADGPISHLNIGELLANTEE